MARVEVYLYIPGLGMLNGHLPASKLREMDMKRCCFKAECTLVGEGKYCNAYLQAQYKYGVIKKPVPPSQLAKVKRGIKRKAQADARAAA